MLSTFHLLTGTAIGSSRMSWVNTVALAFASHFILDNLPHWDFIMPPYTPTYVWAWSDMLFGWFLVFIILYLRRFDSWFFILSACACAILPDVIQFAWQNYLPSYPYLDAAVHFHITIQRNVFIELGVFVQVFWGSLMAYLALRNHLPFLKK